MRSAGSCSGKPRTLQERKQDLVRNEIWKAAVRLFAERGFDGATIEQIAEAAGVSPRTVFRYYPTKESVVLESIDGYGDAVLAAIAGQPERDPDLETVRTAVLCICDQIAAQPGRARDMMRILMGSPGLRAAQLLRFAHIEERLRGEFARRAGRNAKRDSVSRLLSNLTMSVIDIASALWFERRTEKMRAIVEEVFGNLSRLIAAEERPAPRGHGGKTGCSSVGTT